MSDYDFKNDEGEYFHENEIAAHFDEFLNEVYPDYELAGMTFLPADILKSDSIAYRELFLEYAESNGFELL